MHQNSSQPKGTHPGFRMTEEQEYKETLKDKVLSVIIIDDASTFSDIKEKTGLKGILVKIVLEKLEMDEYLLKTNVDGTPEWKLTEGGLLKAYRSAVDSLDEADLLSDKTEDEPSRYHLEWIRQWLAEDDDASKESLQFFFEGKPLEFMINRLINRAQKNVFIINPYVDKTGIGISLLNAAKNGVDVLLITGHPEDNEDLQRMHTALMNAKVNLFYASKESGAINSKILAVDNEIAVISSMNLTMGAEAAVTWESGIASADVKVVKDAIKAIKNFKNQDEIYPAAEDN